MKLMKSINYSDVMGNRYLCHKWKFMDPIKEVMWKKLI